ncbi:MAG: HD domain-containing protein [Negativicutes bacterium]|nr:HD domain-containing protein [Negativicutes bacterium]
MIRKPLLELLHESAHIQRWNDHIRPQGGFTELDKQAHKMILAYILARFEEDDHQATIQWRRLIEGGLFEFLHRIVLTDIKPPVFYELMREHGTQLNDWVLEQIKDKVDCISPDFYSNFIRYLRDPEYSAPEKKILKAAHYLASNWEFQIIYRFNAGIFGVEETKSRIENQLEEHSDLAGVQKIGLSHKIRNFVDLVGQLRFQQRWAQSPRVPETSVMGHMLIVAILAYLCSLEIGACDQRLCNNYFAGLFHDLPEVLTRDIISPVKSSVTGLDALIKKIENRQVEEKLFPLLPQSWQSQLRYFIEDEFSNKVMIDGKVRPVGPDEISASYNEDRFSPIDGGMIKGCDQLAAYIETALSMACGITSRHLQEGSQVLYTKNVNRIIAGVNFGQLFDYFKK